MRIEPRVLAGQPLFLIIVAEELRESALLDMLGKEEIEECVFARGTFEVRLSTDLATHYVLLKSEQP